MGRARAARLALTYAAIATAWIAFSDSALSKLGLPEDMLVRYSFAKGLIFVAATSTALFFLVDRFARAGAEREREYRELFDHNPNPMWFYDLETLAFLRVNDAAVRKYGYTRDEFRAMTIADIRPPDDVERLMANIEATRAGVSGDVDAAGLWRHRAKDGRVLWVDITSHVTEVSGRAAEVVLVRDVTEAYEAREALLQYQQDLERLVSERTAQLEEVNAELKAATEAKSAFLATMSHELRTPLNSIIGFSGILADGMAGPVNDEQARQLGFVRNSAKHLHALIDDILDLSRIESGRVELRVQPVSLAEVVDSVDASVATLAANEGLEWEIGPVPDVVLTTDPRKLMQVLLNLLGNAVKYTPAGSVRLDLVTDAEHVRFLVSDTGPGIPEEARHRIFDEFVRIESGADSAEGTGLGLAIAARFAHLLGGTLELTTTSSAGSTFMLQLPISLG